MFEYWDGDFAAASRRVIDPPMPVLVALGTALPPQGGLRRDEISLRIKSSALDLATTVPGWLYAWAQCTDASWIGLTLFAIPTADGRGRIETRQWVPARALSRPKPRTR
ncbi:hypothetical protein OHB26_39515 (plasmid) [Nocardia sp. NBC_01503]|uniref:hypothetical protein n=1 Tax=Nocardia sp. NBC_01503 TaxID=2975997 RepID=UPI002E7C4C46|nr:hypothetical protein [Nocardia sp. NBC_01503]WTL36679.1 hypothetical protein OHB26_39060 [Nocardia sp. NBC_01503]WTL36768.1 hypothetical protein OHB26_39515 [Nocardia sp. NBC_01503]